MLRINGTSALTSIRLDEGQKVPNMVQVLRTGKFNHPRYGSFEITNATLAEMKSNFDQKVRGIDLAFDYFHESDKEASAWVKNLFLKENDTELWAEVDWTPKAEAKLAERELRYFSPDFAFEWTDPEKNVTFNNVLFGGGLVNRPFVKEMKAIVADETQGENMTDLEKAQKELKEAKAANVKLSEDKAVLEKKLADVPAPAADSDAVAALKKQIADLQAQLAKAQGDSEVALAEKVKADAAAKLAGDQKMLAEKEGKFNLMLSEGKAVAAQKEAYMAGDTDKFMSLAQPINLKGKGSSETTELSEVDAKDVIKLAEEKRKASPGLSVKDSLKLAKTELKK